MLLMNPALATGTFKLVPFLLDFIFGPGYLWRTEFLPPLLRLLQSRPSFVLPGLKGKEGRDSDIP